VIILDRYVARAVIGGSLMALVVLAGLVSLFEFLDELNDVGRGDYTALRALAYVLLTTPRRIFELFPTAVLLGSVLALGAMAAGSELTAMRASGVSLLRIVGSVMAAGLVLVVVAVVLGEAVAPASQRFAEDMKVDAQNRRISVGGSGGLWVRYGTTFLNVREVLPGLRLRGVTLFDLDEELRVTEATDVESAVQRDGIWYLQGVRRTEIGSQGLVTTVVDEEIWTEPISKDVLKVLTIEPEHMSAVDLGRYVAYLKDNRLDPGRYELAFWSHFTTPLASMVMLLLAVPFAFGSGRGGGTGARLLIGVLVGLAFYVLNRALSNFGLVYGFPPVLSAAMPSLLFLGVALLGLRRVR
jgi:lipopolysaccharide export system permease protein